MASIAPVRPSALAGTWYEGNPRALARAVDQYLDQAELPELPGDVVAVIAPHAGHIYSGPVAGYAFAAVRGQTPDLVAVLSPMHQPYYEPLLTTAHYGLLHPAGPDPGGRRIRHGARFPFQGNPGLRADPRGVRPGTFPGNRTAFSAARAGREFQTPAGDGARPIIQGFQQALARPWLRPCAAGTPCWSHPPIYPTFTPRKRPYPSIPKCYAGSSPSRRRTFSAPKRKRKALPVGWVH